MNEREEGGRYGDESGARMSCRRHGARRTRERNEKQERV